MLGSFPPELLVVFTATSLLRSEEPTLSCNQFSTFDRGMSGLPSEIRMSHQIAGESAMLDECQGDWVETEVGVSNELECRSSYHRSQNRDPGAPSRFALLRSARCGPPAADLASSWIGFKTCA